MYANGRLNPQEADVSYEPELTPEQRRREVARILARGILRLPRVAPESAACSDTEAPHKDLEVSVPPRPHGSAG
jgi:hypothetical protein